MSNHRDRTISYEDLLDRILEEEYGDYPEFVDDDGEVMNHNLFVGKWFRLSWPSHCVTCSHLGDATIHGPYDTEEDS